MPLRLADRWLWDFWLVEEGDARHVFFLQAPRTLPAPDDRHWHATIGHAVSTDLHQWEILPDALGPGEAGAWDDLATWTGSILRHDDVWHMLYTGVSRAEQGIVERIGLATSTDLITWKRHPGNPVIEADPRWYELLDLRVWDHQAWRDPWLFVHPVDGRFYALITARVPDGPSDGRGVIARATSDDLRRWEVGPPVTEAGEFAHLEVSQLVALDGRWYLLFSVAGPEHSALRRARSPIVPAMGVHYLVADDPLGPFRYVTDDFLVGDPVGEVYGGKLLEDRDGSLQFLAWAANAPGGRFVGELLDPQPAEVHPDGRLVVARRSRRASAAST